GGNSTARPTDRMNILREQQKSVCDEMAHVTYLETSGYKVGVENPKCPSGDNYHYCADDMLEIGRSAGKLLYEDTKFFTGLFTAFSSVADGIGSFSRVNGDNSALISWEVGSDWNVTAVKKTVSDGETTETTDVTEDVVNDSYEVAKSLLTNKRVTIEVVVSENLINFSPASYFLIVAKLNGGEADLIQGDKRLKKGDTVSFKIFLKSKTDKRYIKEVKLGNDVLTPDENGVYTFTVPTSCKLTVTSKTADGTGKLPYLYSSANKWEGTEITETNPQTDPEPHTDPEPQNDPEPTPTPAPTGNGCGSSVSGNYIYLSLVAFALVGVALVTKGKRFTK
ncbi:MAG: hypothetical protein MJ072_06665, partial [Clostridia bacterium]|nr:hypothetical protein [Clostridia bacterium]